MTYLWMLFEFAIVGGGIAGAALSFGATDKQAVAVGGSVVLLLFGIFAAVYTANKEERS